jgi:hypothetical protein
VSTLSTQAKANCWALAEVAGHDGWGRMQALLNSCVWDHTAVRDLLAPLAGRWLTCPADDPVGQGIAVDETAALKKGDHAFAVGPQHAGCTGKVENCVTNMFATYVTTTGSTWVDSDVSGAVRRSLQVEPGCAGGARGRRRVFQGDLRTVVYGEVHGCTVSG